MPRRRALNLWATLAVIPAALLLPNIVNAAANDLGSKATYERWKNGPPADLNFFPIAVWLQSPKNAARYTAAGSNVYVRLWRGQTEEQLKTLTEAGMWLTFAQASA